MQHLISSLSANHVIIYCDYAICLLWVVNKTQTGYGLDSTKQNTDQRTGS